MRLITCLIAVYCCFGLSSTQARPAPDGGIRACDTLPLQPYFRVGGKYPESSMSLANRADKAIESKGSFREASGYVCFQFLINDLGKYQLLRILQTNEKYEQTVFAPKMVMALDEFIRNLNQWKPGNFQGKRICYQGYMSFKIEEGHVTQVSP